MTVITVEWRSQATHVLLTVYKSVITAVVGRRCLIIDQEPVALTVMVTLTGSLSSPGGGAWLVGVGVEVVRGEAARGKEMAAPARDQHRHHTSENKSLISRGL